MARGIFAFYAAHMPNTLNTIKSYSATFRMPFVTSGMAVNTSRQEVAYELYLRPQYSLALRDIIVKYAWNEIWYIYSSNEGQLCTGKDTIQLCIRYDRIKLQGTWSTVAHEFLKSSAVDNYGPLVDSTLISVPFRYRLNTFGRRAFSVAGPILWNSSGSSRVIQHSVLKVVGNYIKRSYLRVIKHAMEKLHDFAFNQI